MQDAAMLLMASFCFAVLRSIYCSVAPQHAAAGLPTAPAVLAANCCAAQA
jgi:hypothetical protein